MKRIGESNEEKEEGSLDPNNTKLKIFRLDKEGMNPVFDPNITEYYFIAGPDVQNLLVTAIPENEKANVKITGNVNLKQGINMITIEVTSENQTKKQEYKIQVTKTDDVEKANASLETLAIENYDLLPSFDPNHTNYQIEVNDTTESVKILAIPQKIGAQVKIEGGQSLDFGKNKILVTVIAENGITIKKYEIQVYRRNEEEEKIWQEQKKVNAVQLNTKINTNSEEIKEESNQIEEEFINENQDEQKENSIFFISAVVIIALGIISFVIYQRRKKNR
ncbi:MAG TPA: cadherin-like beta sandwich domain-containing protein [Candidatus Merdicola faecigallinarum]|uniref:Cadherin-like beta sandwich domain-containing protein n=1 Tax=Candidatus Merdicola faecigallinarum TaxID=2840862 RepID=A0A9D1M0M7_9FIRM|nr:cadherin-like beta sandwich domain-containing protein [Candidatus Merdicola faecigallinarum]